MLCHHIKGTVDIGLPPNRSTIHSLLMYPELLHVGCDNTFGTAGTRSPRCSQCTTAGGDTHTCSHMKHTILGMESRHQLLLPAIVHRLCDGMVTLGNLTRGIKQSRSRPEDSPNLRTGIRGLGRYDVCGSHDV